MSLEVEKNAKPASKKRGYWGPFIENDLIRSKQFKINFSNFS